MIDQTRNKILRLNRQQQMIDDCVDFHMTRVSSSVLLRGGRSKVFFVINEIFLARFCLSNFHFLYSQH